MRAINTGITGETGFSAASRAALWLLACFAAASTALADAAPPGTNRFLFIIDTSAGIKRIDEPLRQTVFDLIYTGVRGHMTNGDTYGIWLFNDTNDTSLAMEVWKHKFAVELAARPALAVRDRGFRGKPRLDVALADAARVAQEVGDLTVVIVSNGETPFAGTPFDAEINGVISRLVPEMKRAKAPVNTALVAQDGKFVAWAVNSPDLLVRLPNVPPRPKRVTPTVAATPATPTNRFPASTTDSAAPVAVEAVTNAPAAATNAAAAAAAPPLPVTTPPPVTVVSAPPEPLRVAPQPIIITRETVEHDRMVTKALASTQITNQPIVTNVPASAPPLATNIAVVAAASLPAPSNAPAPIASAPVSKATNAAVLPATTVARTVPPPPAEVVPPPAEDPGRLVTNSRTPIREAAIRPATHSRIVGNGSENGTHAPWSALLLWGASGAALAVLVMMLIVIRRNRRDDVSLISRAAAMERLHEPQG